MLEQVGCKPANEILAHLNIQVNASTSSQHSTDAAGGHHVVAVEHLRNVLASMRLTLSRFYLKDMGNAKKTGACLMLWF
jgi:hypothetical protein